MPLIEVDDAELNALKQQRDRFSVADKFLRSVAGNAKTKAAYLRVLEEARAEGIIPKETPLETDTQKTAVDAVEQVRKEVGEKFESLEKRLSERDAKDQEKSVEGRIESGRKKLRDSGYTKEGIDAVEKLMQDEGIASYETATELFEVRQPKDQPADPGNFGRDYGLFDPPKDDDLIKNAVGLPKSGSQERALRQWQSRTITDVMKELRGGQRIRL